jgi:6-phosphogluconolactonase
VVSGVRRSRLTGEVAVLADAGALAAEAARRFARLTAQAVRARGRCAVALSGGRTPAALYHLLAEEPARSRIPWAGVHLFWGDERCVPPDHTESSYRLAHEALISRVPIPPENIHRVYGELDPQGAARRYESELAIFFGAPRPRFDLVLLGLGEDGHVASLFPGSEALDEQLRVAEAVRAEYQGRPADRVTLTLPAINAARRVWFLVSGAEKAEIVRAVLEGAGRALPAQRVRPTHGRLTWLLDAAAAQGLVESTTRRERFGPLR